MAQASNRGRDNENGAGFQPREGQRKWCRLPTEGGTTKMAQASNRGRDNENDAGFQPRGEQREWCRLPTEGGTTRMVQASDRGRDNENGTGFQPREGQREWCRLPTEGGTTRMVQASKKDHGETFQLVQACDKERMKNILRKVLDIPGKRKRGWRLERQWAEGGRGDGRRCGEGRLSVIPAHLHDGKTWRKEDL